MRESQVLGTCQELPPLGLATAAASTAWSVAGPPEGGLAARLVAGGRGGRRRRADGAAGRAELEEGKAAPEGFSLQSS